MEAKQDWWNRFSRAIQTNLQIKDTGSIDPEGLAEEMEHMGADILVFNVGGIYAWYESRVPFHHVNEYLPKSFDLLKEVIDACHQRGLKFVARFDFSKAEDSTYQQHPEWFAQDPNGAPFIIGEKRPGGWPLLYSTCIQSGYWNEEVAVKVLKEALSRYDIDGVFFNATYPTKCWCDTCKRHYLEVFGKTIPDSSDAFDSSWETIQLEENIGRLNSAIQSVRPGLPLILYYWKHQELVAGKVLGDQICDESQDRLSLGTHKIPPVWRPAYSMNRCRNCTGNKHPFGIIHSSPGMDWRHTGLPTAEYDYWVSQVPIFGGSVWHSITGIPATITDKRILKSIAKANEKAGVIAPYMDQAEHMYSLAVLCDDAYQIPGWMSVLHHTQKLYELLEGRRVTPEALRGKSAVLVPGAFHITKEIAAVLCDYAWAGGHLILEGKIPEDCPELYEAAGIRRYQKNGGETVSAYLRFEEPGKSLQGEKLQDTPIIPMCGKIVLSEPKNAQILATLVPSFAPPDAVGAPPERASLPASHTRIPLVTLHKSGLGECFNIQFGLSDLIEKYGLDEHYELAHQLLNLACPPAVSISRIHGLTMNAFRCPDGILIHLANGAGERPLKTVIPMTDIEIAVMLDPSERVEKVVKLFSRQMVRYSVKGNMLCFVLERLDVWESFYVCLSSIES